MFWISVISAIHSFVCRAYNISFEILLKPFPIQPVSPPPCIPISPVL